jgi:23S rRNA pseudouridine2605 synthase
MSNEGQPDEQRLNALEEELMEAAGAESDQPIGDEANPDPEAELDPEAEVEIEAAEEGAPEAAEGEDESANDGEAEFTPKPRPPAKLERLQKILAQSGVASRRKAEEMIEQGRVEVNGKVVTALGTKADMGRDHIRVDGKLLQGAERLRYFVLNKPRGFVTTVKDPEGRPTVMQFFDKMRERLYPVGRLDYLSEGLLLVTNDGELANKLTRASAGVEKTYLVKVSGIPSEAELDILRAGVAIEKGKPGSGKVRTSPARIRQVRQGDNPWYEVVLIEGRNRELRKMFEEVGHFVEKIRRVGYGPLILDQEPGHLRELDAQELDLLRKAADGKLRTPKAKEIRRRNLSDSLPPGKPAFKPRGDRPAAGPKDYRPKKSFGTDGPVRRDTGPARFGPAKSGPGRPGPAPSGPARISAGRQTESSSERPAAGRSYGERPAAKQSWGAKPAAGRNFGARPADRNFGAKPEGRPFAGKPAGGGRFLPSKPAWKKPEGEDRRQDRKPFAPRPEATRRAAPDADEDLGPKKSFKLHIEPIPDSPRTERPAKTSSNRSASGRAGTGRSSSPRPFRSEGGLARPYTTSSGKPRAGGARPASKPGKEGGRSYGAGSGQGRTQSGSGSRPSFGKRPFDRKEGGRGPGGASAPAQRPFRRDEEGRAAAGRPSRPFTGRAEGSGRSQSSAGSGPPSQETRPGLKSGSGWKPKPNFAGKPSSGGRDRSRPNSRPKSGPKSGAKPGGFSKSGKAGGSGANRSGPRPGGTRPGGTRPGGRPPGGKRS